jgi:hypothetical protein
MPTFVEWCKPTNFTFASHQQYAVMNAYSFRPMHRIYEPVSIKKWSIEEKIRNDIIYTFYKIFFYITIHFYLNNLPNLGNGES